MPTAIAPAAATRATIGRVNAEGGGHAGPESVGQWAAGQVPDEAAEGGGQEHESGQGCGHPEVLLEVEAGQEHDAEPGEDKDEPAEERHPHRPGTEQCERHHRGAGARLHPDERGEGHRPEQEQTDDDRVGVADDATFDERVDERSQRDEGEELTCPVEPARASRGAGHAYG